MTVGAHLLFLTTASLGPSSLNSYKMNEYNKGYDKYHMNSQSNKGTKHWPAGSQTLWKCLTRNMNTVVGEEEEGVMNLV